MFHGVPITGQNNYSTPVDWLMNCRPWWRCSIQIKHGFKNKWHYIVEKEKRDPPYIRGGKRQGSSIIVAVVAVIIIIVVAVH